ncbi:MAG: DNA translocase FtsK [Oscillospiraceae bacterium]|nr:DNA translocase FtsK [Oscillospiraceae bacterium]
MAQSNRGKKTSQAAPKSSAKPKKSSSSPKESPASGKTPRRREIMAAVCFVLAAFTFISYFTADGAFINLFTGLARGLVGRGFFYLAPALSLCAIILTFHRGRPIVFRTVCALLLCVLAGTLTHLFTRPAGYEFAVSFSEVPQLWESGLQLESGGVISGTLAELFGWLFGRIGATVVLVILTGFFLLSAVNKSITGIVDAVRNRPKVAYEPQPEPDPSYVPEQKRAPVQMRAPSPKRKKAIDIPVDEAETPTAPPPTAPAEKAKDEPLFKTSANSEEDLPLDIPFMERRRGGKGGVQPGGQRSRASDITRIVPDLDPDEPMEPVDAGPADTELKEDIEYAPSPAPVPAAPEPARKPREPKKPELLEPVEIDSEAKYIFPPLDLLAKGSGQTGGGGDEVRQNSQRLEAAFQSFGVNVKISNATRGPSVTRYEASLEAGVKLSKLTNLADDIALSLGTSGVRIAAMPNMISTVGIEVPNKSISTVYLREIIESREFVTAKSKLTFAIGTNISGESIVGNVSKMPHMLVAGTTGSGKSVSLNSIILSILYKGSPEDVRFIMIDPKMVEFKVYNDIPHLLVPVVTDVKKASGALQWAVFEMTKRYTLFSETSARDLEGYNQIAREDEEREVLPRIVIIIDELADLMMTAAKEVEESVCRVAQMGRAAGMHLIIATQSPRADVITGLMKANIPSRISFKVSSALESRIILDAAGNADKLVGNGDMLFAPIGTDKPMRVQGTWVSDEEREAVVNFVKSSGESQYSEEVQDEIDKAAIEKGSGEKKVDDAEASDHDEMLPQAVDVIFETGQASVSMLQRRLKLGYARAARIVDQMEQMGIVGQFEGSKPRSLLITKDQWRQMQYVSGNAPEDKPLAMNSLPLMVSSNNEGLDDEDEEE